MHSKYSFPACALSLLLCVGSSLGQSISSFTPMFGQVGQQIMILGSGFVRSNTVVRFSNNKVGTGVDVTTANQLYVNVPSGAVTGPLSVQVYGGPPNYSFQDFTVIGPGPYVTDFSPQSGSGGSFFYINGVQFQGNVSGVKVNGTNVTYFYVLTDNQIIVTNRSDVTTGPVTVWSSRGTSTTADYFYVVPIVLSSFSPSSGPPLTSVTLTGKNFLGTTNVQFGGVSATEFTATATQIIAKVPVGARSGTIRVATPGGVTYSANAFKIPPSISSFTPPSGTVNTPVTITGANLNEGISGVTIGGAPAQYSGVQFDHVTATVPATATNGPITVTTTNGTATSSALFFLPPSISSFTPNNTPPASMVKIQGQNFLQASAVTFNGVPAMTVDVTNNTTIGARVPFGVTTGPISVTTPGGTHTSTALFYAPPLITGFDPTHGLPGTSVTIYGTNFLGATRVRVGNTVATTNSITNGRIVITVPAGAQTGPLTVEAPAGTNTTSGSFVLDYTSDLAVTASAAPAPAAVGADLVYTVVVANNGPFSAQNVQLTNTLPATVALKSATTTQGTLNTNGNPVIGNLGLVAAGTPVLVTLTVLPKGAGSITNVARAFSDYPDPVAANNVFLVASTVQPPRLAIERQTNQVKVSWPAQIGWWLQAQTNAQSKGLSPYSTNWHSLPDSSATNQMFLPLVSTNHVFYRLLSPW